MEYFKELSANISEFVRKMSPSQVIMLIGVTLSIIVAFFVTANWIGGEINYSVLYSQLDPSEAAEVVAYLNENNKPHKLTDGGRTIQVPSDEVYGLRISLASEGLLDIFERLGARLEIPGCSLCMGNQARVAPETTVMSTSTRNFPHRMGDNTRVFLGSAEIAAICAMLGRIPAMDEYLGLIGS